MPAKHYNTIVVGESLAGLVAASLAAARRQSVLVIRRLKQSKTGFTMGGRSKRYRFITPGVFDSPVPAEVIRLLNLGHKFRSCFKTTDPLFQIAQPDHRYDIREDFQKLTTELNRELKEKSKPDEVRELFAKLEELDRGLDMLLAHDFPLFPASIKERWTKAAKLKEWRTTLNKSGLSDSLSHLLYHTPFGALVSAVSQTVSNAADGFDEHFWWRAGLHLFKEVHFPLLEQDIEHILLANLDKYNGRILEEVECETIEQDKNGFKIQSNNNTYSAEHLVFACDYFLLDLMFEQKKIRKFVTELNKKLIPKAVWICSKFDIEIEGIPEGMQHSLFLFDEKHKKPPFFFKRDPLLSEEATSEPVEVFMPLPVEKFNEKGLAEAGHRLEQELKSFFPFVEPYIKNRIHETMPRAPKEPEWAKLEGRRIVFENAKTKETFNGAPIALPLKNAYLAGAANAPELGIEGEFIAGMAIANRISQKG